MGLSFTVDDQEIFTSYKDNLSISCLVLPMVKQDYISMRKHK